MTGRQTHGLHIDDGGCTRYIGESQEQIKIVRTQISENRLHIDDGGVSDDGLLNSTSSSVQSL